MLDYLNERFYYNKSIVSELKYSLLVGIFITILLVLLSSFQSNFTKSEVLIFSLSVVLASMIFQYLLHSLIITFKWNLKWAIIYEVFKISIYLILIAVYLFVLMTFLGLVKTTILEFSLFVGITSACGIIPISIKTLWTQNARLSQKLKSRAVNKSSDSANKLILISSIKSESFTCSLSDLLYFKSDENYLIAVEKDSKTHIRLTMKSAEEQLNQSHFLRVHRSYLVNSRFIEQVKSKHLILIGNVQVPISRQFRKAFVDEQVQLG